MIEFQCTDMRFNAVESIHNELTEIVINLDSITWSEGINISPIVALLIHGSYSADASTFMRSSHRVGQSPMPTTLSSAD